MAEKVCPVLESKSQTAKRLIDTAVTEIKNKNKKKINLVWIEAAGCSGNIISLLNGNAPDVTYFLTNMVDLKYNNSIMAAQGEQAQEQLQQALNTEFILIVDGAISTKDNGIYNIVSYYNGRPITGMEEVKRAADKAKYILTVGTCASFGGISAAKPNPSECISVSEFLQREVIKLPGCPCHPDWIMGTIAHLILFGKPELDKEERPIIFYGVTIHDICPRRTAFEKRIFAESVGDQGCMFKLGCRGPVTKTDCPTRKWNDYVNWPIGDNTPCIGCAQKGFPDAMEPFINL
ncbi:hydrogenase small subunit [Clostridium sp. ZS2-4]|uniref:hydrogenase small subunit n=1 Tax=Clostridium sp. ZS2-4 TaxID=2987703 RepID=UPI00227C20A3|nr:hydrogenase small subunit [Clostridium sp. ZS2-4]MCY6356242.1 hydrogenase small subunit [Clostridium sp. ZS2-4]